MSPIPTGGGVWVAAGHTDMRRGMQSLALAVQESLKRDPHAGDLYIFRGRRGDLVQLGSLGIPQWFRCRFRQSSAFLLLEITRISPCLNGIEGEHVQSFSSENSSPRSAKKIP